MSYFPGDIPFMSKEELRENGIKIPKNVPDTNVGDTISRQAVLNLAKDICVPTKDGYTYRHRCIDVDEVRKLPSVQSERKNGKWIYGEKRKFIDLANADLQYKVLGYPHRPYRNMECSSCHKVTIADETIQYNFCPWCGADMRGEQNENTE